MQMVFKSTQLQTAGKDSNESDRAMSCDPKQTRPSPSSHDKDRRYLIIMGLEMFGSTMLSVKTSQRLAYSQIERDRLKHTF